MNRTMPVAFLLSLGAALLPAGASGCGKPSSGPRASAEDSARSGAGLTATGAPEGSVASENPAGPEQAASERPARKFAPVRLGGSAPGNDGSEGNAEKGMDSVLEAMQPLQVVLGKWRGVTSKDIEGMKSIEEPEWIWDFRTNKEQPALVVNAAASPFFKSGRLTFLTDRQEFEFRASDRDGTERVYRGTFTQEPKDEPGENNRLERTFKLTLRQVAPADDRKLARVVFAQQENNRYLMQVYDKRGDDVLLVNTVANQREGTSFALNPDDYGEKKCVVSGGLGSSTVSHDGKTYYVCCSGCRAAFEEDPERWIAKFEASRKKSP